MRPVLANTEGLRAIWAHKLLALPTMIPRPNLPFNQSLHTAAHESDIVRQHGGFAHEIEVTTAATQARTRSRIFYCAPDCETPGSALKRPLRSFSNDLAGPDIDPLSLIIPVRRLIDLFELWKRRAIPAH